MLEAIRDRAQGWIAKVILGLLIIPFALWGVDSYFAGGGQEPPAATVDGVDIPVREFQRALADRKEAVRGQVDDKLLRQAVIDQLVHTQLLVDGAARAGFAVFEPQTQAMLVGLPPFLENGQFSQARLDAWLRSNGMSMTEFMTLLQQDQVLSQIQAALSVGAVVPRASASQMARVVGQQREVSERVFAARDFVAQVQVDDAAVAAYYQANQAQFSTPRQVRVQYAVLSMSIIEQAIQVTDEAARAYYDANIRRFQEPEQRRASHILIQVPADADAPTRQAAQARAAAILAEIRQAPARFAELARQHSQDPGSAQNGGDLGAFTRDTMVRPFADAVWAMQPGELRGPVATEFGYHIIRLDGVVPGARMSFEVVRDRIVQQLRQDQAQRRFADAAERFSNMVYEQPTSLEPAAQEFGLNLATSGWVSEQQADPAYLAHPRLMQALFAEDSLVKRNNVEAVEVAPNVLVSARVLEYRPAGVRPLAEVAEQIRQQRVQAEALRLATAAGEAALAAARAGQAVTGLSAPVLVSRMQPHNLPLNALKAVFRAGTDKLPAYVGLQAADGYRLYRIGRVMEASAELPVAEIQADMRGMVAQEEMRAYLEFLKARAEIEIAPATLRTE